ncbi:MAG: tripartite tricarboxylate transporter substrate binding protein [Betaproteobacteria bacterium]|nr:tripartite tricarboxylate transporter substrate binding protein [Betaproteobacteria bacterium]
MNRALAASVCTTLITCSAVSVSVAAQSFPTRPVRIVVGFAPGGGVDQTARVIAHQLTDSWGQTVIVDNRSGAAGNIAADLVAKSQSDGYTLLLSNATIATPGIFTKLPFDINKDLVPVSLVALGPQVIVVQPPFPARNAKELIALAKSKPKQLLYGSAGVGNINHLAMELFSSMSDISLVHVPYKGSAPGLVALLGGEIQLIGSSIPSALGHINGGKLKPLGVSTLKRSSALPNVPTIDESGLPGYDAASWYGLFAPAGVPRNALEVLNKEILKIMGKSDVRERFARDGFDPVGSNAGEFAQFIRAEIIKWEKVIKARGIIAG